MPDTDPATTHVPSPRDALAQRVRDVLAPHRGVREVRMSGGLSFMGTDRRPMGRGWLTVPREQVREDDRLAYWVQVGIDSRGARG